MKRVACFLGAKLVIVFRIYNPTLFKAVQGFCKVRFKSKKGVVYTRKLLLL